MIALTSVDGRYLLISEVTLGSLTDVSESVLYESQQPCTHLKNDRRYHLFSLQISRQLVSRRLDLAFGHVLCASYSVGLSLLLSSELFLFSSELVSRI